MILGYILICGMGPLEPGTIEGCRLFTQQHPTETSCEAALMRFYQDVTLRPEHYISAGACFVVGTDT